MGYKLLEPAGTIRVSESTSVPAPCCRGSDAAAAHRIWSIWDKRQGQP